MSAYVETVSPSGLSTDQQTTNLVRNGSFEDWTGSVLEQWTLSGAGASVAKDTVNFLYNVASAALTRAGADAMLYQDCESRAGGIAYARGRTYSFACWVRATTTGRGRIAIYDDGVGRSYSTFHCESGKWNRVEVVRTIDLNATVLRVECRVDNGDVTVQFDGAILVEGDAPPAFFPSPADPNNPAVSDTTPPSTPTGLNLATGVAIGPDGTSQVYLDISWNAGSESDLAFYQVNYQRQGDSVPSVKTVKKDVTSIREWGVVGNVVYEVKVLALDKDLNPSVFTAVQTITTAKDTDAPNPPTSVSTLSGFQLVVVRWTPPTAADRAVVEVWRSTTNDSSTATKVGEDPGISFTDDKLANATTYYYWLKSRDTSGNVSGFHSGQFAGVSATTLKIGGADVLTTEAIITAIAQIANAIIQNAHIANMSADKLIAGTIAVLVKLGVNNIEIDGVNSVITVKDTQGTPVTRVKIGKLGGGAADWGIQIFNSAGVLMWDLSQGAQNAGVAPLAIANTNMQELTLGTSKAQADAWTQLGVSSNDGTTGITTATPNWGDVISVTITTNGGDVILLIQFDFELVTDPGLAMTGRFRVLRDSTQILPTIQRITGADVGYKEMFSPIDHDLPSAGTYTYKIQGQTGGSGTINFSAIRLVAFVRKK